MTITRSAGLVVLCLMSMTAAAAQRCKSVKVAGVKSIFAIAPSPVGGSALFYASTEEAEGEVVTGNLFRLRLDGTESGAARLEAPSASNPSPPVWQPDGTSAYFETDQGIYRLGPVGGPPELLWKGSSAGLAISEDGDLLAFWRVTKGADTLVLYDVKKKAEIRTWRLPDRFEGDKSGWDMAFAHGVHSLYARTYDETSRTPLKQFDLSGSKIAVVSPDCYAVAEGKGAVYFISALGTTRSLHKIVNVTARPSTVARDFGYDSLFVGGSPRWLVAQDYRTKETVVFDTEKDAIKSIGKRDAGAVLSDGRLLMVTGSQITVGDSSCSNELDTAALQPGWPRMEFADLGEVRVGPTDPSSGRRLSPGNARV
jgi:hypothetical protein